MKKLSPQILISLLLLLGVAQFIWWGYLILDKDDQLVKAKTALGETLKEPHERTQIMILSEGAAFVVVWVFGMSIGLRALSKERNNQKRQSDFLAAITHELKTPIASINLCLDTLERIYKTQPEKVETYLKRARISSKRLISQVDRALAIAGADSIVSETSLVLLDELVAELTEEIRETYPKTSFSIIKSNISIQLPKNEVRSVLYSVIENAAKYSSHFCDEPSVVISISESNSGPLVKIKDNGPGLGEAGDYLFKAFSRGKWATENAVEGTGLGLHLAHKVAQKWGWTIAVSDNIDESGLSVSLRLVSV